MGVMTVSCNEEIHAADYNITIWKLKIDRKKKKKKEQFRKLKKTRYENGILMIGWRKVSFVLWKHILHNLMGLKNIYKTIAPSAGIQIRRIKPKKERSLINYHTRFCPVDKQT